MKASYDNEILTVTITNYKEEELHVGYGDGKLEKYVEGQWINGWPGGGYAAIEILRLVGLNQSISFRIGFCGKGYEGIGDTEKGLDSGHYRYSHNLEVYNKGEGWITTEFDVVVTFNMPLKDYFEFSEGHYRWTHEVNYTDVSVEFDVYSAEADRWGN